jgi:hypothetical protein
MTALAVWYILRLIAPKNFGHIRTLSKSDRTERSSYLCLNDLFPLIRKIGMNWRIDHWQCKACRRCEDQSFSIFLWKRRDGNSLAKMLSQIVVVMLTWKSPLNLINGSPYLLVETYIPLPSFWRDVVRLVLKETTGLVDQWFKDKTLCVGRIYRVVANRICMSKRQQKILLTWKSPLNLSNGSPHLLKHRCHCLVSENRTRNEKLQKKRKAEKCVTCIWHVIGPVSSATKQQHLEIIAWMWLVADEKDVANVISSSKFNISPGRWQKWLRKIIS